MRYHQKLVRVAQKKSVILKVAEKPEHSYTVGGNVKHFNHSAKWFVGFFNTENGFTTQPNSCPLGQSSQRNKNPVHAKTCT